jgi:acetolactate synthase regulatory subunit
MHYRLDLVLKPAEGALVRVIGMVERRGFTSTSVQAQREASNEGHWKVQMLIAGERPGDTLRLQLEKIYDCVSVSITEAAATGVTP